MLGLGNSFITSKNRIPYIAIDEEFDSGTGGFFSSDADLSNSSGTLMVDVTATSGYAYKAIACAPNATFTYSIYLQSIQIGSGGGHIKIGPSSGSDDYLNVDATTGSTTYSGTFTVGDVTLFVLHLHTDVNDKWTKWDNILIQEDN